jgi:hypothetical protein
MVAHYKGAFRIWSAPLTCFRNASREVENKNKLLISLPYKMQVIAGTYIA